MKPCLPRSSTISSRVCAATAYDVANLAELINAKQGEIRSLLRGELEPMRTREITTKLMAAGLPI